MFSEDGAFRMPYLESGGVPGRYEVVKHREVLPLRSRIYPEWTLKCQIMIDTLTGLAEYEFTAAIEQDRTPPSRTLLRASGPENGKIKLLRESATWLGLLSAFSPMGRSTTRLHRNTRHKLAGSHRLDPRRYFILTARARRANARTGAWSRDRASRRLLARAPTSPTASPRCRRSPAATPDRPDPKLRHIHRLGSGYSLARTHQCRRRGARRPNAVYHATGERVRDLPITARRFFSEGTRWPEARRRRFPWTESGIGSAFIPPSTVRFAPVCRGLGPGDERHNAATSSTCP